MAQQSSSNSIDSIIGVNNNVSDNSIVTGLWISSIIGGTVLILFCILQRTSTLYRYRLVASHVRVPPQKLESRLPLSLVDWAIKAITVSDVDFLLSAGLDAMIMVKLCALGVQLFLPPCLIGVIVLIPLHWTGGQSEVTNAYHSGFMRLTMSNIGLGSPRFWVHLVCVYLYMGWAMWLLSWHYRQYLTLRQTYMQKGDDANTWRQLYASSEPADSGVSGEAPGDANMVHRIMDNFRVIKDALMPTGIATGPDAAQDVTAMDGDDDDDAEGQAVAVAEDRLTPQKQGQGRPTPGPAGTPGASSRDATPNRKVPPPMYLTRQGSRRLTAVADRGFFKAEGIISPRSRFGDAVALSPPKQRARRSLPEAAAAAPCGGDGAVRVSPPGSHREAAVKDSSNDSSDVGGGKAALALPPRSGAVHQPPDGPDAEAGHHHNHNHHAQLHAHANGHGHGADDGHRMSPTHHLPPLLEEPAPGDAAAAPSAAEGLEFHGARHGSGPDPQDHGGRPIAEATEGDALGAPARGPAPGSPGSPRRVSLSASEVRVSLSGAGDPEGAAGVPAFEIDLEAGLGGAPQRHSRRSGSGAGSGVEVSGSGSGAASPPRHGPMARSNSLAPEAFDMEWWRGDRLRPGPSSRRTSGAGAGVGGAAGDGSAAASPNGRIVASRSAGGAATTPAAAYGGGDGADADVRKFRPSVSLRKTVNAFSEKEGRVVAVFAQHYAVLVTDVVELQARGGGDVRPSANSSSADMAERAGGAAGQPIVSRSHLRRVLPRWLTSWCKLGYGTFAARELNVSTRRSSESLDGTCSRRTLTIMTHTSRASHGPDVSPHLASRDSAPSVPLGVHSLPQAQHTQGAPSGGASRPGHRRSQSAGYGAGAGGVSGHGASGGQTAPGGSSWQFSPKSVFARQTGYVDLSPRSSVDGPGRVSVTGSGSGGGGVDGTGLESAPAAAGGPSRVRSLPSIGEQHSAASSPTTPRTATTVSLRNTGSSVLASQSASQSTRLHSGNGSTGGSHRHSASRRPAVPGLIRVVEAMAQHARAAAAAATDQEQQLLRAQSSEGTRPGIPQRARSAAGTAAPPGSGARASSMPGGSVGPPSPSPPPRHDPQQGQQQQRQQQPQQQPHQSPVAGRRSRFGLAPTEADPAPPGVNANGHGNGMSVSLPVKLASSAASEGQAFMGPAYAESGAGPKERPGAGAALTDVGRSASGGEIRLAAGPLGEATEPVDVEAGAVGGGRDGAACAVAVAVNGKPAHVTPAADGEALVDPKTATDMQQLNGGSSLRRRRGAAAGGGQNASSDDGGAAPSDGRFAHSHSMGSGVSGGGDAAAGARARWAWLAERVFDGSVARLPGRKGYSVVSAAFKRLFPDEFDRAVPVINHREVDVLLMQADVHMAQYEYAKKYEEKTGQKLVRRSGWCGLLGEPVRVREFHRQRVAELMQQAREARRRAFDEGHTPSWFVFFNTQRAATVAAQCLIHAEDNRQFKVHPAPGPEEVNWPTLWSDYRSRDLRHNLVRPLVLLVVVFPIGIFTGGLMQLDYLLCPDHKCLSLTEGSPEWIAASCTASDVDRESRQLSWQWYCEQHSPVARLLQRLVVGWLPSLLINLWQGMVLPLVFMFAVQVSRQARSLSEADRCVARYMFLFAVFNVFLGGVLGSTIIQGINSAITNGPSEIFTLVGTYVPTSSNFFINYTMFRALVAVPLRMLWPHIGIRMYLLRRYLRFSCIITQRDKAFLMAPVSPRYGFEVGMILLIFLIAFAFSVVSPILLPMVILFFGLAWLFWRWALLYVYVRKYEGGGTMWPFIFSRVLVCMGIFPIFTACVFVTKHAYVQAIMLFVTVPVILIRFQAYCYYRYQVGVNAMPLGVAVRAPRASVDPWVYFPPPLLSNLAGWNPEWAKCWQGWNLPVMYT